ncbi:MAG: endonuclease/exonuclease/phosphatase family protein [Chthoniobacterales bacterium]
MSFRIFLYLFFSTIFGFAGSSLPLLSDELVQGAGEENTVLRIVAANLTSGKYQSYSMDNGNHSNIEGAGARILKALNPDIVLIQEFNTGGSPRQWVNSVFGNDFNFVREGIFNKGKNVIPNGIISRFPIIASGEWDDQEMSNREFVWAKIALPGGRFLWAISVHLYSREPGARTREMRQIVAYIKRHVSPKDYLVLGGDFNTRDVQEPCFRVLEPTLVIPEKLPADLQGNHNTNANRNRPYDWILVNQSLQDTELPVSLAGHEAANGLVFDTRIFPSLEKLQPAQKGDSGVKGMQHMAVVRDFQIFTAPKTKE